jgi:uncharacterized protein
MLRLHPYHTRPMPATPDEPVDAIVLAGREAVVERSYELAGLPRAGLAGCLPGTAIAVQFRFSRAEGGIGVDTELDGQVVLTCQRCLQPVAVPVQSHSALVLVADDAAAEQVPDVREPIVVEANQVDLTWLAEEEMLLALPLVPLHDEACSAAVESDAIAVVSEIPEGKRQKPFENLRDLLKKQ